MSAGAWVVIGQVLIVGYCWGWWRRDFMPWLFLFTIGPMLGPLVLACYVLEPPDWFRREMGWWD